ncbi:MAG: shikimate kinase [Acidobacteriota bacterium]
MHYNATMAISRGLPGSPPHPAASPSRTGRRAPSTVLGRHPGDPASRFHGQDLLERVGQAIREQRRVLGLSRQALADASGVSTRFLAQIESGTGNVSLRRLDHLARALDVPLVKILAGPSAVAGRRVALVGLRGAGKTTLGSRLAARLEIPFLELDALIEAAAGLTLGQVFELHGEFSFRRLERETLARLLSEARPVVLATGGGLVTAPETYALLQEACFTIWLSARPEDHYNRVLAQGDRRPMADNPHAMAELRALLASREPLYREADLVIDTSTLTPGRAVEQILASLPDG